VAYARKTSHSNRVLPRRAGEYRGIESGVCTLDAWESMAKVWIAQSKVETLEGAEMVRDVAVEGVRDVIGI
jgi:hypothetical protein